MMSWVGTKLPRPRSKKDTALLTLSVPRMKGGGGTPGYGRWKAQPLPLTVGVNTSTPGGTTASIVPSGTARIMKGVLVVGKVVAVLSSDPNEIGSLHVGRIDTAEAAPPAMYPKSPVGKKATSFAGTEPLN